MILLPWVESKAMILANANNNQKGIFSLPGFLITRVTVGNEPNKCAISPIQRLSKGKSVKIQIKRLVTRRIVEIVSFLPHNLSLLNIIEPVNISKLPKNVTYASVRVEDWVPSLITLARLFKDKQRNTVRVNMLGRYPFFIIA